MRVATRTAFFLGLHLAFCATLCQALGPADQTMNANAPFAVVELFTSEGCSSCPPADKLLAQLASEPIVVLSFHVDYWDRLGWKDPHSSPAATQRQNDYATRFKSDRVYTPQMIVNGTSEFVGSNSARAATEVAAALRQTNRAQLNMVIGKRTGITQPLKYQASEHEAGTVLLLALVQKEFTSVVPRGENAGSTLTHVNSVLGFRTLDLAKAATGELNLTLPDKLQASELLLIGYLQNPESGQISAVRRVELAP